MAVVYRFKSTHLCENCYQQEVDRLKREGVKPPAGRIVHVCYGSREDLNVIEIWQSKAAYKQYAQYRKPVTCERGTVNGVPEMVEIVTSNTDIFNCVLSSEAVAGEKVDDDQEG
ncbi:hypothetical protein ACGF0K_36085 [Streptomyces sp. NPDC048156]|uniref:hypothetical protein n=1 Tax=Streptomyces sp. NPDC048156 TaxID=3365502 RepID=UPI003723E2C2